MEVNSKNEKKINKVGLKTNKAFDSTFKKITHTAHIHMKIITNIPEEHRHKNSQNTT